MMIAAVERNAGRQVKGLRAVRTSGGRRPWL